MRYLLIFLAVICVSLGCSKEPILDIREGMTFNPDSLIIESSVKGWELFTWKSGDNWKYSLLIGTNRVRKTEEIWANPYVVQGKEQLKLLLRQMPSGEEIIWRGPEWTQENVIDEINQFDIPPLLTQYDVHSFCSRNLLMLEITE